MRFLLVILFVATAIFADGNDEHHYYKKDLTSFALNANQKVTMREILQEYRVEIREYKQYERSLQKQKRDIFLSSRFDASKISTINQQLTTKASSIEGSFLSKIHKLLTVEQKKKFANYIDEWEIE